MSDTRTILAKEFCYVTDHIDVSQQPPDGYTHGSLKLGAFEARRKPVGEFQHALHCFSIVDRFIDSSLGQGWRSLYSRLNSASNSHIRRKARRAHLTHDRGALHCGGLETLEQTL